MNTKPIVRFRSLPVSIDNHLRSKNTHQSGTVLIISLIMLLLLTLIGATSMQSTSLEEKMAGNVRDENLAFQAAETALRAGEAIIAINPPAFSVSGNGTGGTGLYTTVGAGAQTSGYWQTVDWSSDTAVATYTGGTLSHINSTPRYIIEELPSTEITGAAPNSGDSLESNIAGKSQAIFWYRITARGTGGSDNAIVMVQSIYKR